MKTSSLILILFSFSLFSCQKSYDTYDNYVILVSMDAFRWDYPNHYDTPNLDDMAENGVRAEYVVSSFPTKTFPNHYSIATGLYPDHHGLVNNTFYAEELGLLYRIGNREMVANPDFYGGEPIWNTAEKQGVLTASFFWVGSEAPIQGLQPTYWKPYDAKLSFESRIDTAMYWLQLPLEKRPRLILLYFQEPDAVGHTYGPVSSQTGEVVEALDIILGRLREEILKLPYGDKVNLIVTADHGMGAISPDRYINIMDHVDSDWIEDIYGGNPVYLVDAVEGYEDSVTHYLDEVNGITAWRKEDVPERLHYGTHPRISDVVVIADSSWSVGTRADLSRYTGGTHGYDNRNTDMHNIFYAEGPAFKKAYVHPAFENINIYPLIAQILDLVPTETDGKLENVSEMLKK